MHTGHPSMILHIVPCGQCTDSQEGDLATHVGFPSYI